MSEVPLYICSPRSRPSGCTCCATPRICRAESAPGRQSEFHFTTGYLVHTKKTPSRTLQKAYASEPLVVLGGGAVSYDLGTPGYFLRVELIAPGKRAGSVGIRNPLLCVGCPVCTAKHVQSQNVALQIPVPDLVWQRLRPHPLSSASGSGVPRP